MAEEAEFNAIIEIFCCKCFNEDSRKVTCTKEKENNWGKNRRYQIWPEKIKRFTVYFLWLISERWKKMLKKMRSLFDVYRALGNVIRFAL